MGEQLPGGGEIGGSLSRGLGWDFLFLRLLNVASGRNQASLFWLWKKVDDSGLYFPSGSCRARETLSLVLLCVVDGCVHMCAYTRTCLCMCECACLRLWMMQLVLKHTRVLCEHICMRMHIHTSVL